MQQKQLFSQHFAKRINLNQSEMLDLIDKVVTAYNLGNLKTVEGIEVGYEDVNFTLTTTKGKYLLKVLIDFTIKKPRSKENSRKYVDTMENLRADGVPLPKLFKAEDDYLLRQIVPHNTEPIYMLVMEFFEGVDFIKQPPTIKDIKVIARILSIINSSKMKRKSVYDPWQPQFFLEEYKENVGLLKKSDKKLVDEVLAKYKQMDLKKLPKSIIHADFMRNNLLKSVEGKYCVLDFGVLNYAPRLADVGVFLAGFCLDPEVSIEKNLLAYKTGLDEYLKHTQLTNYEKTHVGTMTRASYALFHMAATHEKIVEHNKTKENDYWIALGRAGLKLTKKIGL